MKQRHKNRGGGGSIKLRRYFLNIKKIDELLARFIKKKKRPNKYNKKMNKKFWRHHRKAITEEYYKYLYDNLDNLEEIHKLQKM